MPSTATTSRATSARRPRGFLYLVAVIDWASRAVLSWRVSNTMDTSFCLAALDDALARHGKPEILNTDSQWMKVGFRAA